MFTVSAKKSFLNGFTASGNLFAPFSSELACDIYPQPATAEAAWEQARQALASASAAEGEAANAQKNSGKRAKGFCKSGKK